mmetsp:Transcript_28078/g.38823  ORF Transcript_28078/g.38823 Transcript_28078/m.38823 type:complete len:354 (-) Transcript_28078:54-1115(-)
MRLLSTSIGLLLSGVLHQPHHQLHPRIHLLPRYPPLSHLPKISGVLPLLLPQLPLPLLQRPWLMLAVFSLSGVLRLPPLRLLAQLPLQQLPQSTSVACNPSGDHPRQHLLLPQPLSRPHLPLQTLATSNLSGEPPPQLQLPHQPLFQQQLLKSMLVLSSPSGDPLLLLPLLLHPPQSRLPLSNLATFNHSGDRHLLHLPSQHLYLQQLHLSMWGMPNPSGDLQPLLPQQLPQLPFTLLPSILTTYNPFGEVHLRLHPFQPLLPFPLLPPLSQPLLSLSGEVHLHPHQPPFPLLHRLLQPLASLSGDLLPLLSPLLPLPPHPLEISTFPLSNHFGRRIARFYLYAEHVILGNIL